MPRTPHAEESSARNARPSDRGPRSGASRGARATKIPRSTISAVLAGRRKLSTANIAALSAYFHVSPAALMELPA